MWVFQPVNKYGSSPWHDVVNTPKKNWSAPTSILVLAPHACLNPAAKHWIFVIVQHKYHQIIIKLSISYILSPIISFFAPCPYLIVICWTGISTKAFAHRTQGFLWLICTLIIFFKPISSQCKLWHQQRNFTERCCGLYFFRPGWIFPRFHFQHVHTWPIKMHGVDVIFKTFNATDHFIVLVPQNSVLYDKR